MTKSNFIKHFAISNIRSNRKTSFVIILTLSLVLTLLILVFSMNHVFSSIFIHEDRETYGNVDVVINYDEYSLSRLVNKRFIEEDYSDKVEYALAFFNVDVLTQTNDDLYYTKMLSSTPTDFKKLFGEDAYISGFSAIITQSLSENKNLSVGDKFDITILNNVYEYQVSKIIKDQGLFSGNAFYVNKDDLLESVYGLNYLGNLGNNIYIKLLRSTDKNDFISLLEKDDNYMHNNIFAAVDDDFVQRRANEVSAMFLGIAIIMIAATSLVVASLFPMIVRDIKKELGVIKSLGGSNRFVWKVYLVQWGLLILYAFGIALITSLITINIGGYIYGIRAFIIYNLFSLLLSLLTVSAFIYIGAKISFSKISNLTVVQQSVDKQYEKLSINFYFFASVILLLSLTLIFNPFSLALNSLIIVITSIYISLNLLSLFVKLISKLISLKKHKKRVFGIVQNKYLFNNKHIHQSIKVLFISLILVVMVFSIRSYFNGEVDKITSNVKFDMALVNINDYQTSLLDEINDMDIDNANEAIMYPNIEIHFNDKKSELIRMFLSMDFNDLDKYFDYDPDQIPQKYKDASMPYVILPKNFKYIYNLNDGDIVTLDLNYKIQNVQFVIGGFFNTNSDIFVYSNFYEKSEYNDIAKINSIFIDADNGSDIYQDLLQKYSLNMYYVIDGHEYLNNFAQNMIKIKDSLLFLTGFMIISFVIVIFNNTLLMFYDLKFDLARIKVLGLSNRKFLKNLFFELSIIFLVVFAIGIAEIKILSSSLKYVILLMNFYKDINSTFIDILIGFSIALFILILSYIYYYKKFKKINIVDEIKMY